MYLPARNEKNQGVFACNGWGCWWGDLGPWPPLNPPRSGSGAGQKVKRAGFKTSSRAWGKREVVGAGTERWTGLP